MQLLILLLLLQQHVQQAGGDTLNPGTERHRMTNGGGIQYFGDGDGTIGCGTDPPINPIRSTALNDSALLILSIVLLSISFFLLYQSIAFLMWASRDDSEAPPAKAGLYLAWVSLIGVCFLWILFLLIQYRDIHNLKDLSWLVQLFFDQPRLLVAPALIASIVPSVIALYKFAIANSFLRASVQSGQNYLRPPLVALIGVAFTVLQLAAAIVTLIMYWNAK